MRSLGLLELAMVAFLAFATALPAVAEDTITPIPGAGNSKSDERAKVQPTRSEAWDQATPQGLLANFSIYEKMTRALQEESRVRSARRLATGQQINAFAILELLLNSAATESIGSRQENVVLIADLQRRDEHTWNRILVVDRLSRTIVRSSSYVPGHPEALWAGPLPPLYVNDATLDVSPFLREGDRVVWLECYDVTSGKAYYENLKLLEAKALSVMALNLQELRITTSAGTTETYQAHDGDRLRIRILGAGYAPSRAQEVRIFLTFERNEREALEALCRIAPAVKDTIRNETLAAKCLALLKDSHNMDEANRAREGYEKIVSSREKRMLTYRLLNDRRDPYAFRFADIVTHEEEVVLDIRTFGIKLDLSPVIAFGRLTGPKGSMDGFNPIKTTPSIGSNIYVTYDGRSRRRKALNFLPGVHMSLLGLGGGEDAKFTFGIVHPIFPSLRHHFGAFLAWHDLRALAWGLTFSPDINFRALVGAEK